MFFVKYNNRERHEIWEIFEMVKSVMILVLLSVLDERLLVDGVFGARMGLFVWGWLFFILLSVDISRIILEIGPFGTSTGNGRINNVGFDSKCC